MRKKALNFKYFYAFVKLVVDGKKKIIYNYNVKLCKNSKKEVIYEENCQY